MSNPYYNLSPLAIYGEFITPQRWNTEFGEVAAGFDAVKIAIDNVANTGLPAQAGQAGKVLTSDGTNAGWAAYPYSLLTGLPTTLAGYGITDAMSGVLLSDWNNTPSKVQGISASANGFNGSTHYMGAIFPHASSPTQYALQLAGRGSELFWRTLEAGVWSAWTKVWNERNDGSGSGCDADTVGGIQGSALALLASPAFTGTPTAPTAAVGTNTTQIASTAYVLANASNTSPLMNGTAATGAETKHARGDHVHPTDTSRAPVNNPTFTGTVTLAADPLSALQAATKQYVDNLLSGLDPKASVRAATTANITLSGAQTIDGVSVIAGDRVLVKDQSTGAQNGVYVAASGAWSRASDFDGSPSTEVTAGAYMFVEEGTANGDSGWVLTNNGAITIGTTALTFTQFSGAGQITAGAGMSKSGNVLNVGTASASRIVVNADDIDLATTGVSASTYKSVTVDVYGRVTNGTNPTTLAGYGITDAQPLDGDLTAIAAIAGTSGLLKKTAANTWSLDTVTYAPLNSPTFTGAPYTPDVAPGATTAQIANMATVHAAKRTPIPYSTTTAAAVTPNIDSHDSCVLTALAAALTINAPTGTPSDGQPYLFRIKDNGTARTLTWNAAYRVVGVTLPTTTVIGKTHYIACLYNSADSKWDVIAVKST